MTLPYCTDECEHYIGENPNGYCKVNHSEPDGVNRTPGGYRRVYCNRGGSSFCWNPNDRSIPGRLFG